MITILDRLFGVFIGVEFREESLIVTILKNSLSGISLLSSSSFPFKDDEMTIAAIKEHINKYAPDTGRVFVSIPDRWALIKFTEVPSTKGKDALLNMMKYEIERHIPFDIDTVLHDFQIVEEKASTYNVVFVTLQKSRADLIREFLGKLSLEPHSITVSSFAALNSIELSGAAAGGWLSIIGIMPGHSVLGEKDETNVSFYIDKTKVGLAVVRNGYCLDVRSFPHGHEVPADALSDNIYAYLTDIKTELDIKGYKKLIVSGDRSILPELAGELSEKTGADAVTVKPVPKFTRSPESADTKDMAPSIGGCFGELGIGRHKINILPHKHDYEIRGVTSLATKVFAFIVILLIVGIVATQSFKQREVLNRINEELKKNEPKVVQYRELSAEFKSYKQQDDFLAAIRESEMTLEVLAELSRMLPDDTWISNLQYKRGRYKYIGNVVGEVILGGFSDSSSKLISILEGSPFFENAKFVGSIKKTRGKEGFKIKASVIKPAGGEG